MKNKSWCLFLLVVGLIVLLPGCKWFRMDFTGNKLKVANHASYDVAVFVNFQYPDTSFNQASLNRYISANDTGNLIVVNRKWEDVIKEVKTISLFFVPGDSAEKYGYEWRGNLKPIMKLVLTESQLDSLNWIITFP